MNREEIWEIPTVYGVFTVCFTQKQVKNINLRVKQDGTIAVSASPRVKKDKIIRFIQENSQFIAKAQEKLGQMESMEPPSHTYVQGESFSIFGQVFTLQIVPADKATVFFHQDYLVVATPKPDGVTKLVENFLHQHCRAVFSETAEEIHKLFQPYGIPMPEIKLRTMKSRWGSCAHTKGIITLNTRLMDRPKICTTYVVLHEFCHFIHPNHSPDFHNLVGHFMPNWKTYKKLL